ncbi:hypothetical protein QL285_000283 [Trifolium repens]|nr:hypothetical protein QL285_000283 [Trifolium repens]
MKMTMTMTTKKKKKLRMDRDDWIILFILVCAYTWWFLVFTCMVHTDMASLKFVDGDEAHKPWMTLFKQWLNIKYNKAKATKFTLNINVTSSGKDLDWERDYGHCLRQPSHLFPQSFKAFWNSIARTKVEMSETHRSRPLLLRYL